VGRISYLLDSALKFSEFLFKTPTNVFTTSKDLVDLECMDFNGCRFVHELQCVTLTFFSVNGAHIRFFNLFFFGIFFPGLGCSEYENCKFYSGDVV
jgi:hypothetical protein